MEYLNTVKTQRRNIYLLKIAVATPKNPMQVLLFFKCEKL